MNCLIIGTGLMGTAFKTLYPEATVLGRNDLDITQSDKISRIVDPIAPDIILNCAAYTQVDLAEKEPEKANLINGAAVGYLARYAASRDIVLVHFSTDYVFDGTGEQPYTEDHIPAPINAYGHSKWLGEVALAEHGRNTYLFRIQWIYGKNGGNFVEAIRKKALETGHLDVVNDQWGSPTWSLNLAEKIGHFLQLSATKNTPRPPYGTYHVAAQGHTNWHDFASEILAQTQITATLTAIASQATLRPAKRPLNGRLNCSKFAQYAALPLPWQEGLRDYLSTTTGQPL